jgi:hypothetical protein
MKLFYFVKILFIKVCSNEVNQTNSIIFSDFFNV